MAKSKAVVIWVVECLSNKKWLPYPLYRPFDRRKDAVAKIRYSSKNFYRVSKYVRERV